MTLKFYRNFYKFQETFCSDVRKNLSRCVFREAKLIRINLVNGLLLNRFKRNFWVSFLRDFYQKLGQFKKC